LAALTPLPGGLLGPGLANGEIVMNIKASGRSAVIVAAGLMIGLCCAVPATPSVAAPAAAASDSPAATKPAAKKHTARHHARHSTKAAAAKPAAKVPAKVSAGNDAAPEPKPLADASGTLPASIADANAQASPADAAAATVPPAEPARAAEPDVVAADQVNDLDRAALEVSQAPPQPPTSTSNTVAMAQPQAQVSSASRDDDAWDKASLIGKIFIAAGGLLTLASAARMFMA